MVDLANHQLRECPEHNAGERSGATRRDKAISRLSMSRLALPGPATRRPSTEEQPPRQMTIFMAEPRALPMMTYQAFLAHRNARTLPGQADQPLTKIRYRELPSRRAHEPARDRPSPVRPAPSRGFGGFPHPSCAQKCANLQRGFGGLHMRKAAGLDLD